MSKLTHFGETGRAQMVDVSGKPATLRIAVARGEVRMAPATLDLIDAGGTAKGDVRAVAELAGIMAAKRTGELIPLCHPLGLDGVSVTIVAERSLPGVTVEAEARCTGPTGVEMEALTAVAVACLTIIDMVKAVDRELSVTNLRLVAKSGGRSGDWRRRE